MSTTSPASPYAYNDSPFGAHRLVLSAVPDHSVVLDVGCGPGYLAQHCYAKDVQWYGLDANATYVEQARPYYVKTALCNLNDVSAFPYPNISFDLLILADVLEHLVDPATALDGLLKHLRPGGSVIVSLPNVAHITVRTALALGQFNYKDSGILDRTHLHLYTSKTAVNLVESCGLRIKGIKYSSNRFGRLANTIPRLSGLLAYNIVIFSSKVTA